jgi:hypothetical protein
VCHGGLCRVVVACGDLLLSEEWKTHCCGFALLADDVLVCCVLCVVCCVWCVVCGVLCVVCCVWCVVLPFGLWWCLCVLCVAQVVE